jgi:hypothetical protein
MSIVLNTKRERVEGATELSYYIQSEYSKYD